MIRETDPATSLNQRDPPSKTKSKTHQSEPDPHHSIGKRYLVPCQQPNQIRSITLRLHDDQLDCHADEPEIVLYVSQVPLHYTTSLDAEIGWHSPSEAGSCVIKRPQHVGSVDGEFVNRLSGDRNRWCGRETACPHQHKASEDHCRCDDDGLWCHVTVSATQRCGNSAPRTSGVPE
jgi:hypothetical protein